MASILVRNLSPLQRAHGQIAARVLFGKSLPHVLALRIKEMIQSARAVRPDLFAAAALDALKPLDRTLYHHLTHEGRRTVDDLIAETGLPRGTIKASLTRLRAAQLIDALPQGQATPGQPGAQRDIWISLAEA